MIENIRSYIQLKKLDGLILNGSDPHLSEYLPHWWHIRKEISNFSGSNGILCITQNALALWSDSRYSIQARKEILGGDVYIEGEENCKTISEWLKEQNIGEQIGIVAENFPYSVFRKFHKELGEHQFELIPVDFPVSFIDALMLNGQRHPLVLLPTEITGQSSMKKIDTLRKTISAKSYLYIITELDSIAWIVNMRGDDIPFNPLFYAYCIIMPHNVYLFTNSIIPDLPDEITVKPYQDFFCFLESANTDVILLDPKRTNSAIVNNLKKKEKDLRFVEDIASGLKAIKNDTEINGFIRALTLDSLLLAEIYANHIFSNKANHYNEYDLTQFLIGHKKKNPEYIQESFYPIIAYGQNSAICHYSATAENGESFDRDGVLLIDSGSHFQTGTTDMTRTWFLGDRSPPEFMHDYTLVLKAHIALATAIFPKGATGVQLDAICRNEIWNDGNDYGHGTGHGVGHRLCVHEGSVRISPKAVDCILKPGMVISNEPGLYTENKYGIRLENLILCCKLNDNFLHFKTLTLFPFDEKSIDRSLLTQKERNWLNSYNRQIEENIYPNIDDPQAKEWLRNRIKNHNF